ncbi:F0F1 ATP synthase subunit epsilon [Poriferisphaera sp. WC338]|uniref:F0F1 ATP synthase subunit epsilon n=1 Tax=Poriferisphaera sp. WC338 TaxID=3425129 RepID=UPI003D81498E
MATTFQCTLVTPAEKLLDEKVVYASIPAHDGQIGVEHLRAPMLVKLGYGQLRLDLADGSSEQYFVGGGFAQVKDDVLTLLTDEAEVANTISASDEQQNLDTLLAKPAMSGFELEQHQKSLDRARARVEIAKHH